MEGKNLRELLINTFELVDIVDKMRKCPSEELKESMYKSIKKDFELSLILLNLKTDFVNEKKRIKYVLRKVKWSRRKSWRLSVLKLKEDFSDNKFDMFDFNFNVLESFCKKYKLFLDKKVENTENFEM